MTATERLPVLFRAQTAEEAIERAKAWARGEGARIRTVASCRRRDDLPVWTPEGPAWEVVIVVSLPLVPEELFGGAPMT